MTWVAVGTTAVTVVGGAIAQGNAADKAAAASQNATNASIAEQRRQFDLTRQDLMPWMDTGGWALGKQREFLSGDMSGFEDSAGYQFARDQGIQGLDRSAAARGGLLSGGHSADLMRFGQGLAFQHADNYWNKLAGLSNTGQATASGLGSLGMGMANQIGGYHMANADAQRQSAYDKAETWRTGLAGLTGAVNRGYQRNSGLNGGGTGWYFGSNPGVG